MVFPELQSTNSARLKWVVGQTTASQGTFVEEPFAILHATSIFWGKRFQKPCSSWKSSRSWLFEFMWRELMWRKTKVEVQLVFQPWFCSRNVWERFFVVKSTCTAWDGCKLFKIHDPRETKDIIEMAAMMISITAIVWYASENTVKGRTLDWLVLEGFDEYLETNGNELTWFYEIYLSWLKIRDVPLEKDSFPVIAICCMLSWLAYFRLLATLDVTKAFSNGCFTQVFIPQDLTTKRHSIL